MTQNVNFNKPQFRKNGIFCQNLPNFDQNLCIQERFCDTIHGLHPCDNYDAFNTNIEDFIGKNSEKTTNN